jgi:hypothetical protein
VLGLGGPSGRCPCWDAFWRGCAAPVRWPGEMHHPCEETAGRRRPSPGRAPACGDGCVQALDVGGTG